MLARPTMSSRRCSVALASMVFVNEGGNFSGDILFVLLKVAETALRSQQFV